MQRGPLRYASLRTLVVRRIRIRRTNEHLSAQVTARRCATKWAGPNGGMAREGRVHHRTRLDVCPPPRIRSYVPRQQSRDT